MTKTVHVRWYRNGRALAPFRARTGAFSGLEVQNAVPDAELSAGRRRYERGPDGTVVARAPARAR
eukprot:3940375-Rhodomonas_salina.3